jgi:hypothetical protein
MKAEYEFTEPSIITVDVPESSGSSTRFIFTPISAMKIKPIDWLIKDHLESESLAEVFGPPESGKSLLAIDWSLCTASGLEWNGHATQKGAVFYIAGEGHNGLMRRFTAWSIKIGIKLDALPLYVSSCSAAFFNGASAMGVEAAISAMAEISGETPRLIVIDTLARNFGGGNENSTEDMSLFIQHIDRHLRERFRCAVLIVHHTGHGTTDRGRGSSALKAAVDTEFSMKRDADLICFTCTKMKDAPHPPEKAFVIEQVDLGLANDDGSPMYGVALKATDYFPNEKPDSAKLGKNQKKALFALSALMSEHRKNMIERGDDPNKAKVTIKDWEAACGLDRNRFWDAKKTLLERGMVRLLDNGYFAEPIIEEYEDE